MPNENWSQVERVLKQLGVSPQMAWRVKEGHDYLATISRRGTPLLPDFTLHDHIHSNNIIHLLVRLKDAFQFKLSEYEAYLLATSAYLHDLGMFFDGKRFEQRILNNAGATLLACPKNRCDQIRNYQLGGKGTGEQIRETHNLLSAFMLRHKSDIREIIRTDDLAYLIIICRGHRKVNLREQDCQCYKNWPSKEGTIHMGLLTALLRLADALDFYEDRAPQNVFKESVPSFLKSPVALEHWLKHYFAIDPYITRQDQSGNITLDCKIHFHVPMKQINDTSYFDFFEPLFKKYVAKLSEKKLNINEYPPTFTSKLGITKIQAASELTELDNSRELPEEIVTEIEASGCKDIFAFLQWLQAEAIGADSFSSSH